MFTFWDPLTNFWTDKARDFVFPLLYRPWKVLNKRWWWNILKGHDEGHVTYFLNNGTKPLVSFTSQNKQSYADKPVLIVGGAAVDDDGVVTGAQVRLMRYWVALRWSYTLMGSKSVALRCTQQELSMKLKSTATQDDTLAQYAWHEGTVLNVLWRTPCIDTLLTNAVHSGEHTATRETHFELI